MAAPTNPDPLTGYSEPGEEEKENYFYGLSGRPRLVARTSTTLYERDFNWPPPRKALATLGDHHIVQRWCPALRNALVSALTHAGDGHGHKIAWTSFYPIRFGPRPEHWFGRGQNPVVLLVGVSEDRTPTWRAALRVALQCRDLLRMFGIQGVEVEVKTSSAGPYASSAARSLASEMDFTLAQPAMPNGEADPVSADFNAPSMPLLPFLGHRIEQEPGRLPGEPTARAGSMGLFLSLASDKPVTYGLTCRHVAVGSRVPSNDDIRETQPGGIPSGLRILSGGATCAYKCADDFKNPIKDLKFDYRLAQHTFFMNPDDKVGALRYRLQSGAPGYAEKLRKTILEHASLCSEQDADATILQRLVGTVAHSACHDVTEPGHFKDWALIRLAENDVNKDTANKVYMAGSLMLRTMIDMEDDVLRHVQYQPPKLDDRGFLRVHGDNIPRLPAFEQDVRLSCLVAKRGATTGLRFGLTNEIEAVRRVPAASDTDSPLVSLHLLVLDVQGGYFSNRGDSGACVFDMSGQVVGILDAGENPAKLTRYVVKYDADKPASLPDPSAVPSQTPIPPGISDLSQADDVTFVTPIQWLLGSIAKVTGQQPNIL